MLDKKVGNVQLMQQMNRVKVINIIRQNKDITRPEIAKLSGLSLSSVTNIINFLTESRFVVQGDNKQTLNLGRKASIIRLDREYYGFLCVFVEADRISVCATDIEGHIADISTVESVKADSAVENIIRLLKSMYAAQTKKGRNILAVAVSVPGMVTGEGANIYSIALKWKSFNLKAVLKKEFSLPIFIQNVSISKAVSALNKLIEDGEAVPDNAVFLDLQQGIGIVQYTGREINPYLIGEIGHTTAEKDGPTCFCGNKGCLEIYCSEEYAEQTYLKLSGQKESFFAIAQKAEEGEQNAVFAMQRCGEYLGVTYVNIINLLNPSVIYTDGGNLLKSSVLFKAAQNWANKHVYAHLTEDLRYVAVNTNREDIISGLSCFAMDKMLSDDFILA